MAFDLAIVWGVLVAFAVFAYVVLDGFDLGIGMLFPFAKSDDERETMINSIAPVWDGNETWLILGGGGLMAAFPLAYAILLPALYAPLIAMLLALVFRGVAFEFRHRDPGHKKWWEAGFVIGSGVATFAQGIALGTFIQGVAVSERAYAGGWFDWLTPFSLMTGVGLVVGYGLLGACWLILKTTDALQDRAYRLAGRLAIAMLVMIGIVSLWTPLIEPEVARRWFSMPNIVLFSPVPLLVGATAVSLYRAINQRRERWPFPLAIALFLLSYAGLAISLYPYIVPHSITIWQAAAPRSSLMFLLVGTLVLMPLILGYTAYAYWVFRGKTDSQTGYH